ncbi:histidine kinase [Fibrisoma limi BUZ 3]|uniref:histidine kinase n=1 Tax=Fibrisoma limi BUZ 3 TaxID=1185876 RepID=I2GLG9_9BACT|nr:ATP-binding protein [Fibrisoma limi]CCH54745.1 histidine kinase [Fibrisoma limi BUZ 3]
MRIRLYLVLLLIGLVSLPENGQAQQIARIDSLPATGLLIRTGWRWHSGDNPAWAKPDFDDSRWDSSKPFQSITSVPAFEKSPLGWFRLTFALDSAVAQQTLSLHLNQVGASEIYLDGTLFRRLGTVGASYDQQQAYTPKTWERYLLPSLSAGKHVLAVRLSQHRPPWYVPKRFYLTGPIFLARLVPTSGLIEEIASHLYVSTIANYIVVGVFLLLSVIHFLYYAYRRQRTNLIFAVAMLLGTYSLTLTDVLAVESNTELADWVSFCAGMVVMFFISLLLASYYAYLKQPFGWWFWSLTTALVVSRICVDYLGPELGLNLLNSLLLILMILEGIRVSRLAVRSRRANAQLLLSTILIMLAILLVGALISYWLSSSLPQYSPYISNVINLLFFMALPVGFAILLARDHAQTNQKLEERLAEIEQLSAEKESILKEQNEKLERQVAERTAKLTQSLAELHDTQEQLIQREKMASLGELTAGIAHEIQNPLNFVNNFADVSVELVAELKEEAEKGTQRDSELEAELLTDLEQNLTKISQHGSRAAGIVRSMLDHTRTSAGQSEPVDLNALVDEFLRLAYHGIRAQDKHGSTGPPEHFNAQLVTQYDDSLGTVTVVPQDIGRVLLNLFNNAFHAVRERAAKEPAGYTPTVSVSTSRSGNTVVIDVRDNGFGVPEGIREKIFQPFFTTKPTGQGTGLGLSLSYDIITKGHRGTLSLESTGSTGTTFRIRLPVN